MVMEVGTTLGVELLQKIPHQPATAEARQAADAIAEVTATQMGRTLETTDIKNLLSRRF